jgi:hypothetical protein
MPHSPDEVRNALNANIDWLEQLPGVTAVSLTLQSSAPKIRIYHSALSEETWDQIVDRLGDLVERGPAMEPHSAQ